MPKFMLPIVFALSLPAQASDWFQSDKPVMCGPFRDIVQNLQRSQYQEMPLWIGQSSQDQTQFSLFVNAKTGAWTLVQYGQVNGCVLGLGNSSDMVNQALSQQKH